MHAATLDAAALDAAAWAVVASSLASSLLRLLLGGLATQAARQALATTGDSEPEAQLRAYRLAVLRALLGALHGRSAHDPADTLLTPPGAGPPRQAGGGYPQWASLISPCSRRHPVRSSRSRRR